MTTFIWLFLANFLVIASLNSLSLLAPFLDKLGASQIFLGVFANLPSLVLVLALSFCSRTITRLHRVRTLRWSFFALLASFPVMLIFSHNLAVLTLCRLLGSGAYVFSSSFLMAMVYDQTPQIRRASTMALFGTGGLLTNPVVSLLGEWTVKNFGGPGLFAVGFGFAFLALLTLAFLHETPADRPAQAPHFWDTARFAPFRTLEILAFLFGGAYTVYMTYTPIFTLEKLGLANLSVFTIPFAAVSIVLRFVFSRDLDRRSSQKLTLAAFGGMGFSFLITILSGALSWSSWGFSLLPWFLLGTAGALYGGAHSLLYPILSSQFVHRGGARDSASSNNVFLVFSTLGAGILAPLCGALGDLGGFSALFGTMLVVSVTAIFVTRRAWGA
ncbi:MAG: MFS transporter [Spirochaetales bacterium]|nr:MFS transporter [Spirochaetales bacterium]